MKVSNLDMYCITLNPMHLNLIKKIGYKPVGLGYANFSADWITDNNGKEISSKNQYYGEYTFHYNLWKNNLIAGDKWTGFCQYRKFWTIKKNNKKIETFENFNTIILKEIPENLKKYDVILGEDLFIDNLKISKLLKHNFRQIFANPNILFNKKKRNLKFHFDMWHGYGNLDKAINELEIDERTDFKQFVNEQRSFNPHNMFICKNVKILNNYYNSLFLWLEKCEKIFGFSKLNNYGMKRIYGFLAERYMSYWFKKYSKFYLLPIYFKDITDFL